ncbi:run domain Beclin-1-interacting and cysteine-rich domain-containing protein isoform X2 [Episyrphus balteatus]|uniref:run domain Beclin-1-interacting and cysteine-rich domain-containing protein isoform X2 n=1 Tax=Episyrphus balteatus TaxID=286459 RepID=UPI0024859045|nr:run domain Beclin-1-interacting and cysteine-rich domain-containing protein isoform X2 [Episyrphus balteatus]
MQSSAVPLQPEINHQILLIKLRKSIELWFLDKRDQLEDEWDDLYSGIQNDIATIISDGLQLSLQSSNKARLQKFADDLCWLKASIQAKNQSLISISDLSTAKSFLIKWVHDTMKDNCLCACVQLLVTDKDILTTYYTKYSFIRNEKYATALFICISAVELNRCSLLTQIDATLFGDSPFKTKRATSHPNLSISPQPKRTPTKSLQQQDTSDGLNQIKPLRPITSIRKWNSLPALKHVHTKKRSRSQTIGNARDVSVNIGRLHQALGIQNKKIKTKEMQVGSPKSDSSSSDYSKTSTESNSSSSINRAIELIKCDHIKIWVDHSTYSQTNVNPQNNKEAPIVGTSSLDMNCEMSSNSRSSSSPINTFISNIFSVPSFRGHSGSSWNDSFSSICHSSSTQNDSVLNSFLPRCGEKLPPRKTSSLFEDASTSEIEKTLIAGQSVGEQSLAAFLQRTQFSRSNNDLERENAHFRICEAIISAIEKIKCQKLEADKKIPSEKKEDESCENAGTSSRSCENLTEENSNSEIETTQKILTTTEDNVNMKEHMPYAELGESSLNNVHSAENIGLSLISKFNDKSLPKASDWKWLVSEEDTPQNLLPMPQQSNNPDDNTVPTLTRGTRYWAPPRQQIIFTNHPSPERKLLIQKQNYRCAGCGMRVPVSHIKSFRYCTYLGKYHCTGCHRNQISAIPSKVLHLWDFKFYPVSVFAYRLLEQMWTYPLFYVPDLNPALYVKSKQLRNARLRRVQAQFVKEFITVCRFAENERTYFASVPDYITTDPDTWSMSDLIDSKTNTIHKSLQDLIQKCEEHIFDCVLCTARGFICEFCRKEIVIYPWQAKVQRCDKCGSCYHSNCWKSQFDCPKCQRLKSRLLET